MIFRKEKIQQLFCECGDYQANSGYDCCYPSFDLFRSYNEVETKQESQMRLQNHQTNPSNSIAQNLCLINQMCVPNNLIEVCMCSDYYPITFSQSYGYDACGVSRQKFSEAK